MTEAEEFEEDLFADLYDGDDVPVKTESSAPQEYPQEPTSASGAADAVSDLKPEISTDQQPEVARIDEPAYRIDQDNNNGPLWTESQPNNGQDQYRFDVPTEEQREPPPIGIKEDGKMFIGGLNWETTDQSLKDYFSQYGEVQECTVMRDGASGRSRGFGFLTFRDPKTVNLVMVKEHYLDGKIVRPDISISTKAPSRLSKTPKPVKVPRPAAKDSSLPFIKIDPKRAIPRDEQERTSKIFVGGVSQDANETVFKEYFAQFGRVVDATLMMDKDTGRPRGFGFVTFDSEAAVDATLAGDLTILGKPIEVKKAQPRGNMREEENESLGRGGRNGRRGGGRFQDDRGYDSNNMNQHSQGNNPNQQGPMSGMTPQMMAQYWQKMQQFAAVIQQQQMAAAAMQNGGMGGMGAMNPAMMQQMQQLQQFKAMQTMMQQQGQQRGSQSPLPQSPSAPGNMQGGMNPAMMQQMQMQMQAMQGGGFGGSGPMGASPQPGMGGFAPPGGAGGRRSTPGYNAQDQLAFEQQKYEQQQARRAAQEAQQMQSYQQGGPTSWEGMYDDVPQPNMGGGGGGGGMGRGGGARGGIRGSQGPQPGPQAAPPANAPTGPKNAGKPGANYRGGGRGGHRGFHPYARNG